VTTVLVLVILALIWAAVLLPPYLQNRRETRPGDSIATFRTQLSVLERTTPGGRSGSLARLDVGRYDAPRYVPPAARRRSVTPSQAAMRRAEVRRRRRDVFLTLLGAVAVTLVLAVALGGTTVWMVQLVVDVAFAGYVLMLVSIQQQAMQAEEKVRYIRPAPRRTSPEPQLLLRRSGS
jgi:nitrate reductase NapE component